MRSPNDAHHRQPPSVRALHTAVGGSTLSIRAYQQRLLDDGVIEKHGQGYRLRPPSD